MYIGIDIGGSHVGVGLLDDKYNIIDVKEDFTNKKVSVNELLVILKKNIKEIINPKVKYIGIGFPGVCNIKTGEIFKASNMEYNEYNIPKILSQEFNIPVYIDNDANCATIAEYYKGNLQNSNDSILLTIGTGIGAGIILNGKMYRGINCSAGEFGHMFFQKDGNECGCGQLGCFEKYAALSVLKKKFNLHTINTSQIEKIYINHDKELIKEYEEWLDNLARGIASIYNILDPEKVVLGGGITKIFDYIKPKLVQLVSEKIYNNNRKILIEKAYLGNDAGIIGASMLGNILEREDD